MGTTQLRGTGKAIPISLLIERSRIMSRLQTCVARGITFAILLIAETTAGAQVPALSLIVDEYRVNVVNATPGGEVVLVMCERGSLNGRTHVRRQAVMLRDADSDGAFQFTPERKVALRSAWIVVDMSSGNIAAAAHPRFPLMVTQIPLKNLKKDAEGAFAAMDLELRRLFLVLVRPRTGAWMLLARDGRAGDADGRENASLTMKFAEARAIEGDAPTPKQLKRDDVLVAIDPSRLGVYLVRIEN